MLGFLNCWLVLAFACSLFSDFGEYLVFLLCLFPSFSFEVVWKGKRRESQARQWALDYQKICVCLALRTEQLCDPSLDHFRYISASKLVHCKEITWKGTWEKSVHRVMSSNPNKGHKDKRKRKKNQEATERETQAPASIEERVEWGMMMNPNTHSLTPFNHHDCLMFVFIELFRTLRLQPLARAWQTKTLLTMQQGQKHQ